MLEERKRKGKVFPISCVIHVENLCNIRITHATVGNPECFP